MILRGSKVSESGFFKKYQCADETLKLKDGDLLPDRVNDFKALEDFAKKFDFKIVDRYLSYHMVFGYHIATIEVCHSTNSIKQ